MKITIKNDCLWLKVDTLGAQMQSILTIDGIEYLWQGDNRYWSDQAPILFPFIGRLTNNQCKVNGTTYSMSIHGFAAASEFQCREQTESKVVFSLESNKSTKEQYPFDFVLWVTYELKENAVVITYKVQNKGSCTMPFAIGGHPGFRVPLVENEDFTDYYLEFTRDCNPDRIGFTPKVYLSGVDTPYAVSEKRIPLSHELFDDDAIILKNMDREVTLQSSKSGRGVKVFYPHMPYVGFWHWPKTDAPYVCIEPWSSLPARQDIVEELTCKSDLIQLQAGKTYENTWEIAVF